MIRLLNIHLRPLLTFEAAGEEMPNFDAARITKRPHGRSRPGNCRRKESSRFRRGFETGRHVGATISGVKVHRWVFRLCSGTG